MILRRLNSAGIAEFRRVLTECREAPDTELPLQMLGNRKLTSAVQPEIEVEDRQFQNRRDAAEYLQQLLAPLHKTEVAFDDGLWTWLTLYFFASSAEFVGKFWFG